MDNQETPGVDDEESLPTLTSLSLAAVAVAQTPGEPAGSFLRAGSESRQRWT